MTFNKIVIVDQAGLDERALQELNEFAEEGVILTIALPDGFAKCVIFNLSTWTL